MAITEECREFLDGHFKLENYAIAKDISLKEWSTLFNLRAMYIEGFDWRPKDDCTAQLHDNFRDPFNKEVTDEEYWESDPIPPVLREKSILDYFLIYKKLSLQGDVIEFLEDHFLDYAARDEITLNSDGDPSLFLFGEYVRRREPWLEPNFNKNLPYEEQGGVRNIFKAELDVDMTFPDDVLKEAFGSWLTARRASEHQLYDKPASMKKFNKSNISKWVKFRTLQYLDLFYAGLYFNCELSDDEIGHYLFRDKIEQRWVFNARDDMRTVKKYGAIIMNEWNLRALGHSLGD